MRGLTTPGVAIAGHDGSPGANAATMLAHRWASQRRTVGSHTCGFHHLPATIPPPMKLLVAMGETLARAAGWDAEPLLKQTWGAKACVSRRGLSARSSAAARRPRSRGRSAARGIVLQRRHGIPAPLPSTSHGRSERVGGSLQVAGGGGWTGDLGL